MKGHVTIVLRSLSESGTVWTLSPGFSLPVLTMMNLVWTLLTMNSAMIEEARSEVEVLETSVLLTAPLYVWYVGHSFHVADINSRVLLANGNKSCVQFEFHSTAVLLLPGQSGAQRSAPITSLFAHTYRRPLNTAKVDSTSICCHAMPLGGGSSCIRPAWLTRMYHCRRDFEYN